MKELSTAAFADVSIVARYRDPTTPNIIEEQCYDISKGGMFVRSFKPLPNGTLIKFECRVDNNSSDIQGIGRVVWQRDEDGPEAPSGMGVKFLVLRPGSPEIIDRIIRRAGPMPKLFDSAQESGQHHENEKAQQRTSYRARMLVGNQADKLASEIKRNRFAKREQLILTAKKAQKLVLDAKKKGAKKTQTQSLSHVRSAPIITITQEDKPRERSTSVDATGQQHEARSPTVPVQTVGQEEGRQNRDDAIGTEAKAAEVNTARVLQLAAQRARELAEREATLRNIEVAAERTTGAEKRSGFLVKGLVFASITAVILLRLGYVMGGETKNERRALQPRSGEVSARTAARAEVDQKSSQEMATQAGGLGQPAVEPSAETKRPTLPKIESSKQEPLKKGVQSPPIESDTTIKPREPRKAQAIETDERFERAVACQRRGDHLCVIQLLSNRIRSEKERRLLARAYRSVEEKQRTKEKVEKYQRISSPTKSWEMPPRKPTSRRSTSGIPDNPYPE